MFLLEILKETISITFFVLTMMIIVEYISTKYKNKPGKTSKNIWRQILPAALLGMIPGCPGTFAAVSMYAHGTMSFAALVTALIATSGDEAFFIFSILPEKAPVLMLILFSTAIVGGFIIQLTIGNKLKIKNIPYKTGHPKSPECVCMQKTALPRQFRKMIGQRIILITGNLLFLLYLFIGYNHSHHTLTTPKNIHQTEIHTTHNKHTHLRQTENTQSPHSHNQWGWVQISFLLISLTGMFILLSVSDHFIKEHLWKHLIKKHFLPLFLWTFFAFLLLHYINQIIDLQDITKRHIYLTLLIAGIVGMIPESGPHLLFVSLYASGQIPFAVLLTNSIVQDGHGALPLLAESRKSFIFAKLLNLIIGLIAGYITLFT
ncbi:MAG: hypothetical protein CSB06_03545 [Bacteroidia bacterium]|nr:MAG: hypothetical protein CSB06_03545 [Bacteroidia bacterium]